MKTPAQGSLRWAPWLALLLVLTLLVYVLRGVLAPLFFAFLIAYMLDPLVDRIEDRGFLRGGAISFLLIGLFGVLGAVALFVLPIVAAEIIEFWQALPATIEHFRETWEPRLVAYGIQVPDSVTGAMGQYHVDLQEIISKGARPVSAFLKAAAGGTVSVVGSVFAVVTIPIFAFYLLYDFDRMMAAIGELVPKRFKETVFSMANEVDAVLGQFFRGQMTVMIVLAILYGVGYSLAGVPLAIPIALLAGLVSFIPYVGGAVALGLALLMCVFAWQGWPQIGIVVGVYAVVQVLEGFVITPKVMGDKVGLSALVVLFSLMVGGELLGLAGVLLAVPVAAVVKIFVGRLVAEYKRSELFLREPGQDAGD